MNRGSESDTYRLLIHQVDGTELLLRTEERGLSLPSVEVAKGERVAPQVRKAVKDHWGLETVCLFSASSSQVALSPARYEVLESYGLGDKPPHGCDWFPIESLSESSFLDREEFRVIRSARDRLESYASGRIPGTFGKPRWLREVFKWVDSEIAALGLRTTGQFRQLNACPTFSLLRLETNGPALWFKAVGEPNLREYPITILLAKHFPAFVPRIIANQKDWNAWLATEVEGTHLDSSSPFDRWAAVARTLADLQIASYGQTLNLIDAGSRDLRVSSLVGLVDPFLEVMAELMEQQTQVSPSPLCRSELLELGARLEAALSEFGIYGIPDTLGHLDFNPGNILISGDRCVFLDWAEASVGPPCVTFQFLLEHLRQLRVPDRFFEPGLALAYIERWRFLVDPEAMSAAIAAVPLIALFTYAVAGNSWRDAARLRHPSSAGHLRSLARRMKREADALEERKALCLC
jgi:hypothetical protein